MKRVGSRVRMTEDDALCGVSREDALIVDFVDNDGTFRAHRAQDGRPVNSWLHWEQVEDMGEHIGWPFLREALSPSGRRLLEAFDGHERLALSARAEMALLEQVPDLVAAIAEEQAARAQARGKTPHQAHVPGRAQTTRRAQTQRPTQPPDTHAGPEAEPSSRLTPTLTLEVPDAQTPLTWR
jgi:hypothetical protein